MTVRRPRRTLGARVVTGVTHQWRTLLALTAIWVLLWGDLSWANVVAGFVIAVTLVAVLRLPVVSTHGTVRPWPLLVLAWRFAADLVVASFQVALQALRVGWEPRGAVVGVRLRNPSDAYLTITAELSSLVPGSVVVEAHRLTGMLYLHVLDLESAGGAEQVRRHTLDLEARVLRAFASTEELVTAGLLPPVPTREASR